jgi:multiple sugar transport system ATP-binding protein
VEEVAALLELASLLGRKPKDLSGGERQRVALGRAIVREPVVFLFDEPLSNLDARLRGEMRMQLQKLHRRLDTTMIYVTHDQMEAMTMGNRIAVLRKGRIQQAADPLTLYHRPANRFVAGFIGSPPMNQIEGKIESGGDGAAFARGSLRIPLPAVGAWGEWNGREVVLGVRPEDVRLAGGAGGGSAGSFAARVEVVEPLGSETLLSVTAGEAALVLRLPGAEPPGVGDELALAVEPSRVHFFSPADGEVLRGAAG